MRRSPTPGGWTRRTLTPGLRWTRVSTHPTLTRGSKTPRSQAPIRASRPRRRRSARAIRRGRAAREAGWIFRLAFQLGLLARSVYDANGTQLAGFQGTVGFVKTQAVVLTLGALTLYSVPGELFPELAVGGYDGSRSFGATVVPDDPLAPDLAAAPAPPYLHDLMPGRHRWAIGLGLDGSGPEELGRMVPPYDFKLNPGLPCLSEAEGDHYEETSSVGPEIVPRTQAVLRAQARALTGP